MSPPTSPDPTRRDVYTAADLADFDPESALGAPGEFPFTRGVQATGYRGRPWTMRQYAGFTSAAETNVRFHELLTAGQTGLSVAFDLPTQMGYDSDDPLARGEVGRVGVPIATLEDMDRLFADIDLGAVSSSMTINATAAILLVFYEVTARRRGTDPRHLRGTIQNDILKEYLARGTHIFPPGPSLRLVTDTIAYCVAELPAFHPISISGYHLREAGATAVQELAFTLANAIAYVEGALAAGLAFDAFAPRLSFFFAAHNDLFEEVAKFRAARRLWAYLARDRFGSTDPRSQAMRFHVQTAGSTLVAQQPETNTVRTTIQALAAVLGGTQSLHTNALDEALGLPTPDTARLALRTQQVLRNESGVAEPIDPLGGSYYLESLTNAIERDVLAELDRIATLGGTLAALEAGYQAAEIGDAAYRAHQAIEAGDAIVVGVNAFTDGSEIARPAPQQIDPLAEADQVSRLVAWRNAREPAPVAAALAELRAAAAGSANVLPVIRRCAEAGATVGEIAEQLRSAWGEYRA